MFEFVFKYSSYVYGQGEFVLAAGWPATVAAMVLGIASIPVLLRYSGVRGKSGRFDRAFLTILRLGVLAAVLFMLLRPSLVVETAVPQENFVGILIDDYSVRSRPNHARIERVFSLSCRCDMLRVACRRPADTKSRREATNSTPTRT